MKKKTETKVEMKEKLLSENALELNDTDLEGAAGGRDFGWSDRREFEKRMQDAKNQGPRFSTEDPYKDIRDLDQIRKEMEQMEDKDPTDRLKRMAEIEQGMQEEWKKYGIQY